jgi:formiminoglutamase
MSGESSSAAEWFSLLEPAKTAWNRVSRSGDPRLGDVIVTWQGDPAALTPHRPVLLGFPQDEGVRRNFGRPGAAQAPDEIRRFLERLTPWDGISGIDLSLLGLLDLGNIRIAGKTLESTQTALAEAVGGILAAGAIPIVLGGGHETAFGHYLGYVRAGRKTGIVNVDAHLDVRPCLAEGGHSGSPFLQALEHPTCPLPGDCYVCLGAQPHAVSREHWEYVRSRGGHVFWAAHVHGRLSQVFAGEAARLAANECHVYVTVDADAVNMSEVPGVSAPNPCGHSAAEVLACVRLAGQTPAVASVDIVEINPQLDRDGQSARWAALVIWNFLVGLANRVKAAG